MPEAFPLRLGSFQPQAGVQGWLGHKHILLHNLKLADLSQRGQRGSGSCCASLVCAATTALLPLLPALPAQKRPSSWLVEASQPQDRVQQLGTWLWRGLEAVPAPEMGCALQAAAALGDRWGRDSTAGVSPSTSSDLQRHRVPSSFCHILPQSVGCFHEQLPALTL